MCYIHPNSEPFRKERTLSTHITVLVQKEALLETFYIANVRAKKILREGYYRGRCEENEHGKTWIIFPEEKSSISLLLLKRAWEEGLVDVFYTDTKTLFFA